MQPDRDMQTDGVDAESYLRNVFVVIADWPVNGVSKLLPWASHSQVINTAPSIRPCCTFSCKLHISRN